jgi:Arc/MetJ family transcription regulator
MRTTLDIDDDVLAAAKELARSQHTSAGRVVSELLRQALSGRGQSETQESAGVGGFRPFSARGKVVTNDRVNELRDAEGV